MIIINKYVMSNSIYILKFNIKIINKPKQNKLFPGKSKAEYFGQIKTWQI